jgi:hypothetical protein
MHFSKVLYIVAVHRKYTRSLTFENLYQDKEAPQRTPSVPIPSHVETAEGVQDAPARGEGGSQEGEGTVGGEGREGREGGQGGIGSEGDGNGKGVAEEECEEGGEGETAACRDGDSGQGHEEGSADARGGGGEGGGGRSGGSGGAERVE